jgi:hypothetical protein
MYPHTSNAHFTYVNVKQCLGEGNRPLARPRRRWEDNINMELQEVRCGGLDWIDLAHDRDRRRALVNVVMNLRFP